MKNPVVCAAVLTALCATAMSAHAQIIVSGQFALYNDLQSTDVAGVVPADNWNVYDGGGDNSDGHTALSFNGSNLGGENLATSANVSTGIGMTLSYDAQFESDDSYPNSSPNYSLLRAAYFTRNTNDTPVLSGLTLSLSGMTSTDTYALYVYIEPPTWGSGSTGTITDGTQTFSIEGDKTLTSFTQITGSNADGNYVEFTGITGSSSLSVSIPGANTVGVAGFQLEDLGGGSAVPEPSTWAMMLGGVLMLGVVLRKRTKTS
jgi:hypothetical protein